MLEETRQEAGIISALQGALNARIDAQTIYHLLMDKGIFTREEIQEKKAYIAKQYRKEQDALIQMSLQNDSDAKFQNEMEKMLQGKDYDKEYLQSVLENIRKE